MININSTLEQLVPVAQEGAEVVASQFWLEPNREKVVPSLTEYIADALEAEERCVFPQPGRDFRLRGWSDHAERTGVDPWVDFRARKTIVVRKDGVVCIITGDSPCEEVSYGS